LVGLQRPRKIEVLVGNLLDAVKELGRGHGLGVTTQPETNQPIAITAHPRPAAAR
jgi:hypothetical protein